MVQSVLILSIERSNGRDVFDRLCVKAVVCAGRIVCVCRAAPALAVP
jgi:hypothetical protein